MLSFLCMDRTGAPERDGRPLRERASAGLGASRQPRRDQTACTSHSAGKWVPCSAPRFPRLGALACSAGEGRLGGGPGGRVGLASCSLLGGPVVKGPTLHHLLRAVLYPTNGPKNRTWKASGHMWEAVHHWWAWGQRRRVPGDGGGAGSGREKARTRGCCAASWTHGSAPGGSAETPGARAMGAVSRLEARITDQRPLGLVAGAWL